MCDACVSHNYRGAGDGWGRGSEEVLG